MERALHGDQPHQPGRALQLPVYVQRHALRHSASVHGRSWIPFLTWRKTYELTRKAAGGTMIRSERRPVLELSRREAITGVLLCLLLLVIFSVALLLALWSAWKEDDSYPDEQHPRIRAALETSGF